MSVNPGDGTGAIEKAIDVLEACNSERRECLKREFAHDGVARRARHGRKDGFALAGAVSN